MLAVPQVEGRACRNVEQLRVFLASLDPVALDTVALSLLGLEASARGEVLLPHEYLHIAHEKGLGVHEDTGSNGEFRRIDMKVIKI